MDARDVFSLEILGRTTVQDGREVVVYSDGEYRHAVLAKHFDRCGFPVTGDDEETADNYAAWNRATDQWLDDLTAIEAAWSLDLLWIHSASGGCALLDADTHGACRAIAEAHSGEHYTSPAFARDSERVDWDGVWPVVDRDGELTGEISEGEDEDDVYNVDGDAMISHEEAIDGGWTVDEDGVYAVAPMPPPPPAHPRWIDTAEQADKFLATHRSVRLDYRRVRGGWVAVIHGSSARPMPHGPMRRRRDLELTLAHRYLAQVYGDHATVYLPWARRLPNWASDLAALPELARAIEQAERERAEVAAV
jgi:hypothetical protein